MLKSFKCLIDDKTRILVVGTMPGRASLAANEYYAYSRNAFWPIIADTFNQGKEFKSYSEKISCLRSNAIGLWDNLKYCEREGSLDSNILNESPNDFETLLTQNPQIKTLLFNGQKSFAFFKKYHAPLLEKIDWQVLPSTSPANAQICFSDKLSRWRLALKQ